MEKNYLHISRSGIFKKLNYETILDEVWQNFLKIQSWKLYNNIWNRTLSSNGESARTITIMIKCNPHNEKQWDLIINCLLL